MRNMLLVILSKPASWNCFAHHEGLARNVLYGSLAIPVSPRYGLQRKTAFEQTRCMPLSVGRIS